MSKQTSDVLDFWDAESSTPQHTSSPQRKPPRVTIEEVDDDGNVIQHVPTRGRDPSPPPAASSSKRPENVLRVPLAARRSLIARDPDLLRYKERMLTSALEVIRPYESLVRRSLSEADEQEVDEELRLLDRCVEGYPIDENSPFDLNPRYRPSRFHHARLMELLKKRQADLNLCLAEKGVRKVDLPRWNIDGSIEDPWDEQLFMETAVLFREDVENFLAYCLHPGEVPVRGVPSQMSRRERAQAEKERRVLADITPEANKENVPPPDAPNTCTPPKVASTPFRSALKTPATAANTTPLGAFRPSSVPEQLLDSPYDERNEIRSLREELARERTPNAPRFDSPEQLPHERFGSSRRLTEIFQDPPFVEVNERVPASKPWTRAGKENEDISRGVADDSYLRVEPTLVDVSDSWLPASLGRGNGGLRREGARISLEGNENRAGNVGDSTKRPDVESFKVGVPHFDMRLKVDLIDEWDGNMDTIIDWFESVNSLANRSTLVFNQLGELVPTRLTGKAKAWWLCLPRNRRLDATRNWSTLRRCIALYYLGRQWWDRLKIQARDCRYRDANGMGESPSEYFIRKFKLLDTAEDYSDSVMIMSIMDGAPKFWRSIIDTMTLRDTADLQAKIHYHEDALRSPPMEQLANVKQLENRVRALEGRGVSNNRPARNGPPPVVNRRYPLRSAQVHQVIAEEPEADDFDWPAHSHLAGWSKDLPKPPFPRDDSVRSKGKTPEDKGARPCRHCGSLKHWDPDCKHARSGMRQARANLASASEEFWDAQDEYDHLCYEDTSEGEIDEGVDPTLN